MKPSQRLQTCTKHLTECIRLARILNLRHQRKSRNKMSMNKKIALATIIYFAMCGGMCAYCLSSELVKDLSAYMTINPGESKQSREMKQEYNLNQYLNQRDARTQESYNHALNNFSRSIDNINYSGRTPTYQEIHRNYGGILDD